MVASGVLRRVVDGGYTFGGVDDAESLRCAALCSSRPHLVVSGPTAGRLWDLRRAPRDGLVHVVAPPHSQPCREPWVRPYRTALLAANEIVQRADGIRMTSPPRTIVDMTRYVDDLALASMIEAGLHRGVCSGIILRRTALRLATPGRPWARRFLAVLDGLSGGPPSESHAELRVFTALVERGVPGLARQVEVDLPGYGRARFDLAVPDLRWALEIDLHPTHDTLTGVHRDHLRDDGAEQCGWQVRRVGELELDQHFAATIDRLVASIGRRRHDVERRRAAGLRPVPAN
ncbi:hypothetical protein BH18ACT2_BH18ACT2_13020 [soil metagenome]